MKILYPNFMTQTDPEILPAFTRRIIARKTILVADDDANDAFLLERAFMKTGINADLRFVRDGSETIRYLESMDDQNHPTPDLLLLDLKMPRLDGFDVLKWLRSQPQLKRLLVIMLTSSDARVDIDRAYDLGANSYLVKPFSAEYLVEMVQALQRYWFSVNLPPECVPAHQARVSA